VAFGEPREPSPLVAFCLVLHIHIHMCARRSLYYCANTNTLLATRHYNKFIYLRFTHSHDEDDDDDDDDDDDMTHTHTHTRVATHNPGLNPNTHTPHTQHLARAAR
jgi:hypothetical protein